MSRQKPIIVNDSVVTECFSSTYPYINNYLVNDGDHVPSRNGSTREIIDFKTTITNPYKRLVGNNKRNVNVFFLMAEALWIWAGRRDVAFLNIFNSRMKDYSDDGEYFHAPYGWRMRKLGVDSMTKSNSSNLHAFQGQDQILTALQELSEDADSRRVVVQIWNSELDLGKKSKDLPCNDLLMIKIRNGKLRSTIANRSNDLHWGLPTNVYQFSFVTEIMAQILGRTLGTQTHNSQSLHFYMDNEIALKMNDEMNISDGVFDDLYDRFDTLEFDFDFTSRDIKERLKEVDYFINGIIVRLEAGVWENDFALSLRDFDEKLYQIYSLLNLYVVYQKSGVKTDEAKINCIQQIVQISRVIEYDFQALAINFFSAKLKDKELMDQFIYNF